MEIAPMLGKIEGKRAIKGYAKVRGNVACEFIIKHSTKNFRITIEAKYN